MKGHPTIRRYTSINQVQDAILNYLGEYFSTRDVELYSQWCAGMPLTRIVDHYDLNKIQVSRVIKSIEERIESCLSWSRVEALLAIKPARYSGMSSKDLLTEMDTAIATLAALRVDAIAGDDEYLRTIVRHSERSAEFENEPRKPTNERIEVVRVKRTPLEELSLSIRAYNSVWELHARTVEDVCKLTRKDFLQVRSCGARTVNEIRAALACKGLAFADEEIAVKL